MATLSRDRERERRAFHRSCGTCSHCCTVLRVDELGKPAGQNCMHQRGTFGCGVYATRPPVCRGYQCLWLQGGLEDDERPDQTLGIVDLEPRGAGLELRIREIRPGAFDESPALRAIADRYRDQMPVRISDSVDIMNPDRPFRVLLGEGVEHRVTGEWSEVFRDDVFVGRQRLGWAERLARRLGIAWQSLRLRRRLKMGSH